MTTKALLLAAAFVALTAGAAQANPCVSGNSSPITDCNASTGTINHNTNTQNNNQTTTNNNHAYGGTAYGGNATGGAGGNGGAGGAGGNAQQQQQQNQSQSQSSTSSANNEGNNQSTVFNDRLQAPAVSSFIAASGPCTGVSGGGAVSVAGFGFGASFASLEEDCKKRELLRIGFASGNAHIQSEAAQGYDLMFQEAFPKANQPAGQTSSTSATPAAIHPEQTASAAKPECIGQNTHTNWYANNCGGQ